MLTPPYGPVLVVAQVDEYAIALVGLEDALGEYMERERERARAEAKAKVEAEAAEAKRLADEAEAASVLAMKKELIDANPSQAGHLPISPTSPHLSHISPSLPHLPTSPTSPLPCTLC